MDNLKLAEKKFYSLKRQVVFSKSMRTKIEPGMVKFMLKYDNSDDIKYFFRERKNLDYWRLVDEYDIDYTDPRVLITGGLVPEWKKQIDQRMQKAREKANEYRRKGVFSESAMKKMKEKIGCLWLNSASRVGFYWDCGKKKAVRYRLVFLTLTIPDQLTISDYSFCVNKLLHAFERVLRERYGANWVWKGEIQRRGTPHFHIIMDTFLPKRLLTFIWNKILISYDCIKDYQAKTGKKYAYATNVQAVNDLRKLRNYLAKYMMKPIMQGQMEAGFKIESRMWGCSKRLKQVVYPEFNGQIVNEMYEFLDNTSESGIVRRYDVGDDARGMIYSTVFIFKNEGDFASFLDLFGLNFENFINDE